jgi:S1-C subfamily serine protease
VIDQFVKTGQVRHGTLGVRAQRVTDDLATAFGLDAPRGAIVTEVDPKGPAAGKMVLSR